MRAAKIIATLGPKTRSEADIENLVLAGADVFRLNLSYDSLEEKEAYVALVRSVERRLGKSLCLIADLSGPRFRLGIFREGSVNLQIGQIFRFDQNETAGNSTRVYLPVPEAFTNSSIGDLLSLDDGRVILRVIEVTPVTLTCTVIAGEELSSHKIISFPKVSPKRGNLTQQDQDQIFWARKAGIDWLSAFWPRDPRLWNKIRNRAGPMKVLAKMESQSCLMAADLAVASADGLVVARGDLGYDLPPEDIPGWQKRLVRMARQKGKPVIIAAQMLESMVSNPTPTRAEASDVANAVRDGADALMLSAETAIGAYPKEAVALMASVIASVESDLQVTSYDYEQTPTIAGTIAKAAAVAAESLSAALIFTFTSSGSTALAVACTRPKTTIVCTSDNQKTLRQMQLVWGLKCQAAPALKKWQDIVNTAVSLAKDLGVESDQPIVITAGMPFGTAGSTNILRIATAE